MLPNGTNSGGLAVSSKCWPTARHTAAQKMEVSTLNARKTVNAISLKQRELCT